MAFSWISGCGSRRSDYVEERRPPERYDREVRRQDTGVAHEYAGDVTVEFTAITQITPRSNCTHYSGQEDRCRPVTTSDGKIELPPSLAATVEFSGDVVLIRGDAEQAAYDKSLASRVAAWLEWGADVGFSLARGK